MNPDNRPPLHPQAVRSVAVPLKPTPEDRALKFIEEHNVQIWAAIALLALLVVSQR